MSLGKCIYRSVLRAVRRLEVASSSRFAGPTEKSESVLREFNPIYRLFLAREMQRQIPLADLKGTWWSAIYGMHGAESLTCELVIGDKGVRYLQWRKLGVGDCHVPGGELSLLLPLTQEEAPSEEKEPLEIRVRETEVYGKNPTWENYQFRMQFDHEFTILIPTPTKKDLQMWKFNRILGDSKEMYDALRTVAKSKSSTPDDLSSSFGFIRWVHHRAEAVENIVIKEREALQSLGRLFGQLRMARLRLQREKIKKQISEVWANPADHVTLRNFRVGDVAGKKETWGYMIKNYNEAIERDPHWPEVWYKRALAHFERNRSSHSYSLFDLQQVLRREPRHFGALNLVQYINNLEGNLEKELHALRLLMQVMPYSQKTKKRLEEVEAELNEAGGEETQAEQSEQNETDRLKSPHGKLKRHPALKFKSMLERAGELLDDSSAGNSKNIIGNDDNCGEEGYPTAQQNIELADSSDSVVSETPPEESNGKD